MRERKPLESTILKYIAFLKDIATDKANTITAIVKAHSINRTVAQALFDLKFVEGTRDNWKYIYPDRQPSRKAALEVLDYCLHANKKTIHVPIVPEWATMVAAVSGLTERIGIYITQNENALKRTKHAPNELPVISGETLFTDEERRFKIMLAIATGHYSQEDFITPYTTVNKFIIKATDDLLKRYHEPVVEDMPENLV